MATSKNQGFFGRMINSITSGEGIVLNFTGKGKVVICSCNRNTYQNWIQSMLGTHSGERSQSGGLLDNLL